MNNNLKKHSPKKQSLSVSSECIRCEEREPHNITAATIGFVQLSFHVLPFGQHENLVIVRIPFLSVILCQPKVSCLPELKDCYPSVGKGRLFGRLAFVGWVCVPDHVPDLQRWLVLVVKLKSLSKLATSYLL